MRSRIPPKQSLCVPLSRLALQLAIVSCGDAETHGAADAFGPEDLTPLSCDVSEQPLPLASIPDGWRLKFFHQIAAACDPLEYTQILLLNKSGDPVTVDRVGVSGDRFIAKADGLPRVIGAGEALPVSVAFRSAESGEIGALVAIHGPTGCSTFSVTGRAVRAQEEDGAVSMSAYAMDFGSVPRDTAVQPQELSILVQPGIGATVHPPENIAVSGDFEIVGKPRTTHSADCILTTVTVRFLAKAEGSAIGAIGWQIATTVRGSTFEGTQNSELRGEVQ